MMLDYAEQKLNLSSKSRQKSVKSGSRRNRSGGSNFNGSEGRSASRSPGKGKSSMIEKEKA